MKKISGILLLLFAILAGFAQTETRVAKTIKGKVVNSATNEAVSYANIGIEDTFHGTASDGNGNFQLKIPEEMVSKRITFSSVGYKSEILPVNSLFSKEFNIIKLEPHTYDIEKIDVAAQSRVLIRILRMASENTPYNFISGPFNLVGTYKNEKVIDDSLHVVENAKVLIYDRTGYREPSKTNSFRMRKYTINKDEPDYSFATGFTNFDELLELDWVRNASSVLNPSVNHLFEFTLEDEPVINGNQAWVISFKETRPTLAGSQDFHATEFQGKITILKDDYAVKRIEGSVNSAKHNRQGKSLAVGNSNSNYFEDVSYDFAVTYSKLKPDLLSLSKTYRYNGQQVEEKSQLNITGVQIENVKEIANRNYFAE
jgi:hypothetical protein